METSTANTLGLIAGGVAFVGAVLGYQYYLLTPEQKKELSKTRMVRRGTRKNSRKYKGI